GALGTIPAGALADRTRRTLLLTVSVALWSLAMIVTGAATSFAMLIGARVGLGAVTATAGPTILSMTGDAFPARSRGRVLGLIDSGELVGGGFGFLAAASLAALVSWRAAFFFLAALGLGLSFAFFR